jgi:hypothetical protein
VSVPILAVAVAALLAVLGVLAFIAARRDEPSRISLTGVGGVSHVTLYIGGVAAFAMAYHIVAYTFGLTQFRAPWWLAVSVAVGAVLMSVAVDAMENRGSRGD